MLVPFGRYPWTWEIANRRLPSCVGEPVDPALPVAPGSHANGPGTDEVLASRVAVVRGSQNHPRPKVGVSVTRRSRFPAVEQVDGARIAIGAGRPDPEVVVAIPVHVAKAGDRPPQLFRS